MRYQSKSARRQGSILPLTVVSLVGMCGFVALAVDIGIIAVAKCQCQNAADAAAMAGSRSLDGTASSNLGAIDSSPTSPTYGKGVPANSALGTALQIAQANTVIGDTLQTTPVTSSGNATICGEVTLNFGAWHYDTTSQLFTPQFPPVAPDNYNLLEVTVTHNVQTMFAPAFNVINPWFNSVVTVTATSQAAHRPRDVAIILDYSGSMNNESDL
jgi:hypothetical protein